MAIMKNDSITGVLGESVFYFRNGKKVIRLKPENYTDKKSPAQLFNRDKMRLTSRFISAVKSFIHIGYQATDKEKYDNYSNEARQYIFKNGFLMIDNKAVADYSKFRISRGEIAPPEEYSMETTNINSNPDQGEKKVATIRWKTPQQGDLKLNPEDKVMICMFSNIGEYGLAWLNSNVAERKDGSLIIPVPNSDELIHFWMFFNNTLNAVGESQKKISDSVYLGKI